MAAPAATDTPVQRQQNQGKGGKAAAPPPVPFTRAADEHWEPAPLDYSAALSSTTAVGPISLEVPVAGYLRSVLLRVPASGGAGAGVVAKADAPWSVIQSGDLSDVSGSPILDALT